MLCGGRSVYDRLQVRSCRSMLLCRLPNMSREQLRVGHAAQEVAIKVYKLATKSVNSSEACVIQGVVHVLKHEALSPQTELKIPWSLLATMCRRVQPSGFCMEEIRLQKFKRQIQVLKMTWPQLSGGPFREIGPDDQDSMPEGSPLKLLCQV